MSKRTVKNQLNLEKTVMTKITTGAINMKPRWFFILGSVSVMLGLISASIGAIFLMNLIFFSLRQHGPMGEWRLQLMIENFPWWILLSAICGVVFGIYLLKKYDFSYKKNFSLIAGGFVVAIILAAFLVDLTGINDLWSRQGPMRKFYQRYQPVNIQDAPTQIYRGKTQNKSKNFTF